MNTLTLYRSTDWQTAAEIKAELDARAEALRRLKALPLTPREITSEFILTPEEEQGLRDAPIEWVRGPEMTDAEADELERLEATRRRNPGTAHEL